MKPPDTGFAPASLDAAKDAAACTTPPPPPPVVSRALVISTLLLIAWTFPWITSFAEWRDYRNSEFLLGRRPWGWGELPLVWLFFAKTQLVLLPGVLLAVALAARRWLNLAQVTLLGWLALVVTWVVIEKQTYTRTNVHALDYLRFVGDAYAVQWAGSLRTMVYAIVMSLLSLARSFLVAALIVVAVVRLVEWATRRFGDGDGRRARRRSSQSCRRSTCIAIA
jgi:hypothetical protein